MAITKFNSVEGFSVGEQGNVIDVVNNVGNVSANNLTVAQKSYLGPAGNVKITGGTANYVLKTDGLGNLTWTDPTSVGIVGQNTEIQFNNAGSFGTSANFTFDYSTNTLDVGSQNNGTVNTVNINTTNLDVASYASIGTLDVSFANVAGNANVLGNINVSDNANVTGNVNAGNVNATAVVATDLTGTLTTSSQPNVTHVGILDGLSVAGDTVLTGNLTVTGTTTYVNSTTAYVKDPIVEQGGGANGAALSTNDSKDRGLLLHYYDTQTIDAFMGWDNSNGEFAFGSNVGINQNVITFNELGNVRANVVFANLEGTLRTSSQPNITSVGRLTDLTVGNSTANTVFGNGTISASGNVSAANFSTTGNVSTSNISVSANATVTGNVDAGNVNTSGKVIATGNVSGSNLVTSGNVTALGNISAIGNVSGGNLTTTGIVSATGNIETQGNLVATGNVIAQNISTSGDLKVSDIVNGTSNIHIEQDSNVSISVGGVANVAVVTSTGAVIDGNLEVTQDIDLHGIISTMGVKTDNLMYANGVAWDLQQAAGDDGYLQFNTGDNFDASSDLTFNKTTKVLTVGGNITSGNVDGGNLIKANYFKGVFDSTSSSQPNITHVGTLDTLDVTGNIAAGGVKTDHLYYANGVAWDLQEAAGSDGQLQFNTGDNFDASSDLTFNKTTKVLSVNGNVSGANLIASANLEVTGNASIGNISTGVGEFSGNIKAANANLGNLTTSNYFHGKFDATSSSQPNIHSVGTLDTLDVTGNIAAGGVKTDYLYHADGTPWDFQQPAGSNTEIVFNLNGDFGSSSKFTFNKDSNVLTVTGNVDTNNVNASYVNATSIDGVFNLTSSSQPNITHIGTLDLLNVTANVTAGNLNTSGKVVATGNVSGANLIASANLEVTGNASIGNLETNIGNFTGNIKSANANLGNLATANFFHGVFDSTSSSQPNIHTVGTLDYVDVTGNVTAGNIKTDNLLYANGVAWDLQQAAGDSTQVQFNTGDNFDASSDFTFDKGTKTLSVTANVDTGNVNADYVNATALDGVFNASSSSQPNITHIGTLDELTVSGAVDITNTTVSTSTTTGALVVAGGVGIGGNLNVNGPEVKLNGNVAVTGNLSITGDFVTVGASTLTVKDAIIDLHTGTMTQDDGLDVGIRMHYYKGSEKNAFAGWANDSRAFEYYVDATETNGVISGTYGNIKAASFISNVSTGTQPLFVNSTTEVPNLNVQFANNVTSSSQPNITSVGRLTGLTIGNATANTVFGNGTITTSGNVSTGNLKITGNLELTSGASITGNADVTGNISATGNISGTNITATANVYADRIFLTNGLEVTTITNGTSNIVLDHDSNINLSVGGVANVFVATSTGANVKGAFDATGNISGANLTTAGKVVATGNIEGGNLTTTGNVSGANLIASANLSVTGNATIGNISTGIGEFTGNLTSGNANLGNLATANFFHGKFDATSSSQPNIHSVGTLSSLTVDGGDLTVANANIKVTSPGKGILIDNLYHLDGSPWDLQQPAGANTEIVFNLNGDFGASTNFTFDKDTNILTVAGTVNTDYVNATSIDGVFNLTSSSQPNIRHVGELDILVVTGNVDAGNLNTSGKVVATGNVSGANIVASANVIATNANLGNLTTSNYFHGKFDATSSSQPNITSLGTLSGLAVDGSDVNLTNANLHIDGVTHGIFVDNLYHGDGTPWDFQQPAGANTEIVFNLDGDFGSSSNFTFDKDTNTLAVIGNIDTGNVNTTGKVVATGNVEGGNVTTTGKVVATGNVEGGNVTTTGKVVATGNVSGANLVASANVIATNANLGNLTTSNYFHGVFDSTSSSQPNITSLGTLSGLSVDGSDVNLTNANLHIAGSTHGIFVDNLFYANGVAWDLQQPSGSNTEIVFNDDGNFGSSSTFTYDKDTDTLGVTNLVATSIDGVFTALSSSQPNITHIGTLDLLVVTGNVDAGNLNTTGKLVATGNVSGANLVASANVIATNANLGNLTTSNYFHGKFDATSSSQPNITSLGTLTGLDVNGNLSISNATATNGILTDNLYYSNGQPWDMQQPSGSNTEVVFNLDGNFGASTNFTFDKDSNTLTIGGNIVGQNANLGNLTTSNYFHGKFDATSSSQPNIHSVGTLDTLTVTGDITASANIAVTSNVSAGNISVSGNLTRDGKNVVTFVSGTTKPTNPTVGDEWYDSASDVIYQYISDGASSFWVDISSGFLASNSLPVANTLVMRNENANIYANAFIGNRVEVSGNANLYVPGGTSGQALTTDGAGNLSWTTITTAPSGTNTQVQFNDNGVFGGNANLTFDKTTGTLTATAFAGNGSSLHHITGANVTGNVANANLAGHVTEATQSNITAVGTLTELTVSGVTTLGPVGNVKISGGTNGQYLITDGAGNLSFGTVDSSTLINGTSNVKVAQNGNITISSAGNANIVTVTGTGVNVSGTINSTGNLTAANANLGNLATANFFSGNGSALSSITGANVTGNVANANLAGYVTQAAQSNITSLGTLTGLTVSGDTTLTGNLTVTGTFEVANVTTFKVKDPIIEQGGNVSGGALTSNDGFDRGQILHYYSGSAAVDAFMGWDNSNGEFALGSNVSVTNEVVTFNTLGNLRVGNINTLGASFTGNITAGNANLGNLVTANYFSGSGNMLSNIQGANVSGAVNLANYATTANSVAGANVTGAVAYATTANSVAGANVSGNVANANLAGYVTQATQSNITAVGTLTSLTVSGNANVGNIGATQGVFTGNISAGNANLGNLATANFFHGVFDATSSSQPNITTVGTLGNLTISSNLTVANASVTGTLTSGNITTTGSAGNISGANYIFSNVFSGNSVTTGNITATSNVTLGAVANVHITGGASGQYLYTDGAGNLAWGTISQSGVSNGTSNVSVLSGGNVNLTAAGNTTLVVTGTGVNVAGYINATGNITGGNANLGNAVTANYFIGSGNNLSNIQAANITGTVANANYSAYAGNVTVNAQPNITSVGILTSLAVTGNANVGNINAVNGVLTGNLTLGGNLTVSGNTTYVNSTVISFVDPIIELNTLANGLALSSDNNKDSGFKTDYYDTTAKSAFFGRVDSSGYFEYYSNATETTGVISGTYGVIKADSFISSNTSGAPFAVSSTTRIANLNASFSGVANTVNDAAQPNITSVGTLTSANVSGNLTAGNANLGNLATANFFSGNGSALSSITGANVTGQVANALVAGTVYTNAQPNITSLGNLSSVTVEGQSNLGNIGNIIITGGTNGYVLTTNGAGNLAWAPGDTSATASFVSAVKVEYTGDGSTSSYILPKTPASIDAVTVVIDGLVQLQSTYTLSGATITFSGPVASGQKVEFTVHGVVPMGGVNTQVYFNDAGSIGHSANFAFDKTSNTLTVTNVTAATANIGNLNVTDSIIIDGDIIPTIDVTYSLGTPAKRWKDLWISGNTIQLGDSTIEVVGNSMVLTNPIGGQFIVDGSNAAYASLASYVTESNQANITQVGTLLSLDVSGDITANNISTVANITVQGGYLTIDNSIIGVSSGNAGIFNTGVSNINLGLTSNVTIGSTSGNTAVRGNLSANALVVSNTLSGNVGNFQVINTANLNVTDTIDARYIKVGDLYSSRAPVYVTNNTVVDSFDPNTYRSAKYTIRVNSDDGYQAAEVLLIHDGINAYATIYGSLSTIGHDIVLFAADFSGGFVKLIATTSSTNTTVNVLGTYVAD